VNGSFGNPSTASDGIHEMAVTDDWIRMVAPFASCRLRSSYAPAARADKIGALRDRRLTAKFSQT
jgi:hypothetical protein